MDQNTTPQPVTSQSTEQEAQDAVQQVMPPEKKPGRKALLVFATAVLMGLVGYGVYAWQNSRVATLQTQVDDLKKEAATKTVTKVDPYAGWKSYTAKYEKFTLKYPESFTIKTISSPADSNEGLASDKITLTAPNGLTLDITTGLWGVGGGCDNCSTELSEKITVMDSSYFLNYINSGQASGVVSSILLANKSNAYLDFLKAKTILNADGTPSLMSFTISYKKTGSVNQVPTSLKSYQADKNMDDMKLVLESLSY